MLSQATIQALEAAGLLILLPLGILCMAAVKGQNTERLMSEPESRGLGID